MGFICATALWVSLIAIMIIKENRLRTFTCLAVCDAWMCRSAAELLGQLAGAWILVCCCWIAAQPTAALRPGKLVIDYDFVEESVFICFSYKMTASLLSIQARSAALLLHPDI